MAEFSVFRNIYHFLKPMEYPVENFCSAVFWDIRESLVDSDADVMEIIHFKEKGNLQHEFLVVEINHGDKKYFVRVERSTRQVSRRERWGWWTRTSSSIAVVADSVKIATSLFMLTTGLGRGDSYRLATLSLRTSPYSFREFSLLLSMFCIFSPEYKLMGEQCYWFVDVIRRAVHKRTPAATLLEEPKYSSMAGKYGSIAIPQSVATRDKLVQTFKVLAAFKDLDVLLPSDGDGAWHKMEDTIEILVLLISPKPRSSQEESISAVTAEIQRLAAGSLALMTQTSPRNRDRFPEAKGLSAVLSLLETNTPKTFRFALLVLANMAPSLPELPPLLERSMLHLISFLDDHEIAHLTKRAILSMIRSEGTRQLVVAHVPSFVDLLLGFAHSSTAACSILSEASNQSIRKPPYQERKWFAALLHFLRGTTDHIRSSVLSSLAMISPPFVFGHSEQNAPTATAQSSLTMPKFTFGVPAASATTPFSFNLGTTTPSPVNLTKVNSDIIPTLLSVLRLPFAKVYGAVISAISEIIAECPLPHPHCAAILEFLVLSIENNTEACQVQAIRAIAFMAVSSPAASTLLATDFVCGTLVRALLSPQKGESTQAQQTIRQIVECTTVGVTALHAQVTRVASAFAQKSRLDREEALQTLGLLAEILPVVGKMVFAAIPLPFLLNIIPYNIKAVIFLRALVLSSPEVGRSIYSENAVKHLLTRFEQIHTVVDEDTIETIKTLEAIAKSSKDIATGISQSTAISFLLSYLQDAEVLRTYFLLPYQVHDLKQELYTAVTSALATLTTRSPIHAWAANVKAPFETRVANLLRAEHRRKPLIGTLRAVGTIFALHLRDCGIKCLTWRFRYCFGQRPHVRGTKNVEVATQSSCPDASGWAGHCEEAYEHTHLCLWDAVDRLIKSSPRCHCRLVKMRIIRAIAMCSYAGDGGAEALVKLDARQRLMDMEKPDESFADDDELTEFELERKSALEALPSAASVGEDSDTDASDSWSLFSETAGESEAFF